MCWLAGTPGADFPAAACLRPEPRFTETAERLSPALSFEGLLKKLYVAFNTTHRLCWSLDEDFLQSQTKPRSKLKIAATIRSCSSILYAMIAYHWYYHQLLAQVHRIVASRGCTGQCMRCGMCCCLAAKAAAVCVTCVSCQQLFRGICWNFKPIPRYQTCHQDCTLPPGLHRLSLLLSAETDWHSCSYI